MSRAIYEVSTISLVFLSGTCPEFDISLHAKDMCVHKRLGIYSTCEIRNDFWIANILESTVSCYVL
jgi:hypothetical protein